MLEKPMEDKQANKTVDDNYDSMRENKFREEICERYIKKMRYAAIAMWVLRIHYVGGAILSFVQFFRTDHTKFQLMYAAIFLCCTQLHVVTTLFSRQPPHSRGGMRDIKRLELWVAELSERVKTARTP